VSIDRIALQLTAGDDRAREIARHYWAQDEEGEFIYRVSEIAEQMGISGREVRELVNQIAVAESATQSCQKCNQPRRYSSRTEAGGSFSYNWRRLGICADCLHQLERQEQEAERARAQAARKIVDDSYRVPTEPLVDTEALQLDEAVALLALKRLVGNEKLEGFEPLGERLGELGPTEEYGLDLLRRLSHRVLWVDPASSLDAFVWEGDQPNRFYLDRVAWQMAGPASDFQRVFAEIEQRFGQRDWPESWETQMPTVQVEVAAAELQAYLVEQLERHHIIFSPGEKTHEVTRAMSEHMSIGQGYNLIWRSVQSAAAFLVRERTDKRRAAGYAVGSLRRTAEKAIAQAWDVRPFKRSWELPEPEVTHVLYRLALGEDDPLAAAAPRQSVGIPAEDSPSSD
jgi:hypothetical protein